MGLEIAYTYSWGSVHGWCTWIAEYTYMQVGSAIVGKISARTRTAHIKVGKVLAEAAGAIIVSGLEDQARMYGVLDIGSYTSNIYTLERLTPDINKCHTYEVGVSTVVASILRKFEDRYSYPLRPTQQAELLPCYLSGDYSPMGITSREQISSLMNWTSEGLRDFAESIKNELSTYWRTGSRGLIAANFSRAEIVGGGAYYLMDFLKEYIPNLTMQNHPEYSNVRGYAWFANLLLSQRR